MISVFIGGVRRFWRDRVRLRVRSAGVVCIGALSGVVLATPIYLFARFLYGQQATSESPRRISSARSAAS